MLLLLHCCCRCCCHAATAQCNWHAQRRWRSSKRWRSGTSTTTAARRGPLHHHGSFSGLNVHAPMDDPISIFAQKLFYCKVAGRYVSFI
jgi:hypothetical protein